ncbi:MAG: DNA polymerase I [Candidatus Berkelbacteria bacterium]|nr:MAG: DNA polymerase I [Candidatus Berkelbacteria bacterium]QQG51736.1 MAG: DNA polymerase I [Candidatus Berkelbacteria bacterium]
MAHSEKILLLDANALIHRSYHALPPLTTPKGEQVNAVFGFATALLKAIKDEKPDYVVACFDVGKETFRNEIYGGYKAHRKETDEALTLQIPRVREIVEVLNIPLFAQKGVEADDLIGSLTKIAADQGLQSIIVTGDNDALQLVNGSTSVYSLRRGVTDTLTYNRQTVFEKMGIFPEQIVDYKALAGDSSDNIPGAPGIGPKTAVELLQKYRTLDNVYEHFEELKERTRQILTDNKETVMMSRKLGEIKCDLDIALDLKAADVANFDFTKVVTLFHELDFKSLLSKLPQGSLATTQGELFGTKQPKATRIEPSLPYEAVTSMARWRELQAVLTKQPRLVIDTETVTFDDELIGVAFAWGDSQAAYLPLAPAYPGGLPIEDVRSSLQAVLGSPEIKKIGHNLKYDLAALRRAGFTAKNVWFDTMLASQLVNTQLYSHGLDALAFSELGLRKIPTSQILDGKKNGLMTDASLEDLAAYACEDVIVTWRLWEKLFPSLEEVSLKRVFYEIEMPLVPVLTEMELVGIKIDRQYLEKLRGKLVKDLAKIEIGIRKLAGRDFNVASPSQLQEILFTDLKLPATGIKKIKSGYSTDADSLLKLRGAHPIIQQILEYRELAKLLNTYVETLPKMTDDAGRLHTSFGQIGAATGRLSSNNPNLQNIPIRSEPGTQVRRAFVAERGKVLLGIDYSQIELRILAHLCEDPDLIEAFHKGDDFHAAVAESLGVDRRAAKAINFGIIFGLGANALANDLGISSNEARQFIDSYFKAFPGVAKFIEKMKQQARDQGYVSTIYGRRRYLPDIHAPNMMLRSAAERMAMNMPIQGTEADIMKLAMVEVAAKLPKGASMLLQIHDELLFEVEPEAVEGVATLVKDIMGSVVELKVPLTVDVKTGPNWADLKPLSAED